MASKESKMARKMSTSVYLSATEMDCIKSNNHFRQNCRKCLVRWKFPLKYLRSLKIICLEIFFQEEIYLLHSRDILEFNMYSTKTN